MILHITTQIEWEKAKQQGEYSAPSLMTDGFIHCSTTRQTIDTANLFFKGQSGLVLLCIDEKKLKAEYKYEDPSGSGMHNLNVGNLFPHIYGPINNQAVIKIVDFPANKDGSFSLPKGITTD